MTSSMLAGERRWASARRGGMTVLGKVAVPKPINLPSQKLENHGLDPNVEIVPKGSLSWGSRPSSSASNPWGSSPSPSGDCSSGSPSHVGGRPSSGGSGTRPSTAGSDRMHEPSPSAWGSNSRPSSASGALTSNQTSLTPLRPQSAETRPGSSQLSRFAEHLPDSSVAWGPTGNVDKLTVASTKNDDFSLSSGDFPTLGSERDNCGKISVSQDYGSHDRPMSSSGEVAPANDGTVTSESNVEAGGTNTWKRDDASHPDDGVQPNSNNWQGGYPQQFMNTNAPPQHFDAWHGPSMNSPAGVWYSGPPGGPPYGPPVAPGGFPLEPFPYYRPQMPPPALGNSQPVPEQLSVAGPRGHHPKNGDLYRPQIPEAYMHPGMPVRPGFYPRPVPYDNYYRPPMGYCNPNERDIPFMGMSAGPPIFNRYPGQNTPDHSNTHVRAGGHGSNATTLISEQVESGNRDDSRGPYKVLTKQHNDLDAQGEKGSWDNTVPGNVSFPGKGGQPRATFRKNEWGADGRREEMQSRRTALGEYSSSRRFDDGGRHSLNSARVKSPEIVDHAKSVDQSWGKKSENVSSHFPEIPRVVTATPKDSTLLQKIEGLNAKARASDGRLEVPLASSREEQKTVSQYDTAKSNNSMNEVGTAACSERPNAGDFIHVSGEAAVSKGHMIRQAGTSISRRAHNGVEGIVEHRGKGRINTTDPDGWRKKPLGAEYFTANPTTNVGPVSILHNQDHHIHAEVVGTPETSLPGKDEGESLTLMLDSSDTQAQRAKMRELAKQRAIQLQREEEERSREQKAKALAKLEELNRRTLAGDGLTQNLEKTPVSGIIADQEDSETLAELVKIGPKNEASNSILDLSPRVGEPTSVGDTSIVAETIILSKNSHMDTSKIEEQGTSSSQPSSLELHAYSARTGAVDVKAAPEINNNSSSKHMPTGYKQNQSIQVEKPFSETLISFGTIGLPNIHEILVVGTTLPETVPKEIVPNNDSTLSDNSNMVPKLSTTQGKKVTKSSKNKSKLEKPVSASQLQVSRQPHSDRASFEIGKYKASQTELDPGSVQSAEDLQQASEQHSLLSEESQIKVNTQRKSQPSRRVSRSGQSNKMADRSHGNDATIWAPVRSHNKAEAADEVDRKSLPDSVAVTANSNNLGQSNPKGKRAEMERYVPKPVAKEHAQQGILQISVSSSVSQTTPDQNTGRKDSSFQRNESSQPPRSVVENVGRKLESNTGDSKQSRQGKARGGWKEHGSTESSRVQMGSYLSSNSSKNIHKYMDQQEYSISDVNQVADPNFPNGWDPSDGWNMPEEPSAAVTVTIGMKDQGGLKGKGKRHPYNKSHRSMANKHDLDQKNSSSGEMYKKQNQSAAPETSQAERNFTAKESRGNGEKAASLWQPKSQAYSAYSPTGSRSSGGQHVSADTGRATKKDSPPEGCEDVPQLHPDQSVSRNKSVGESMNVVHQEGRREKKVASGKECPQPHKHGLVDMDELTIPESVDTRFEQRSSSGFCKHGNQNKSVKGRELREDWSSVGQDSRHQNVHGNRERQPRNSHYEYQPVGPYNHGSSHNFEGPTDGSHNMGSRYRERGQGQSRRGGGNSYGRKSGVIQVDAGYD